MKSNTRLLVTGGAGYVGSVLSHYLNQNNLSFAILDNKKKIDYKFFPKKIILYKGDISNELLLEKIYNEFRPTHIVHLAAKTNVLESSLNKERYKSNNIIKSKIFFDFFIKKKIKNLIFASSAAVYSNNNNKKKETLIESPANYYGKTKFIIENYLIKKKKKHNLNVVIMRFFNVIGSHYLLKTGNLLLETKSLFSSISRSMLTKKIFKVNNVNYPTRDGTAIRDYIDVNDIARIIVSIIKKKIYKYEIINLGTGVGYTVLEITSAFEKNIKKKINIKFLKNIKLEAANIVSNNKFLKELKLCKFIPLKKSIMNHYNFYKKNFLYVKKNKSN